MEPLRDGGLRICQATVALMNRYQFLIRVGFIIIQGGMFMHTKTTKKRMNLKPLFFENKWGYINEDTGELRIEHQFCVAYEFETIQNFRSPLFENWDTLTYFQYAIVGVKTKDDITKYGIIDIDGNFLVTPHFDEIKKDYHQYLVTLDKKVGLIDSETLKLRIPAMYDSIERDSYFFPHNNSYNYLVSLDGMKGIVNENNKIIIKIAYEDFPEGQRKDNGYLTNIPYFLFRAKGKIGLLDRSGKIIFEPKYDWICYKDNFFCVLENKKWTIITLAGTPYINAKFDAFSNSYLKKEGKEGYYSNKLCEKDHAYVKYQGIQYIIDLENRKLKYKNLNFNDLTSVLIT